MTRALVVGCSNEVWQEVEAAQAMAKFDAFYICKMAGIHWDQGFFWWVTLHPEFMAGYKADRAKLGLPDTYQIVAPLPEEVGRHWEVPADRRTTYKMPGMRSSGASGLFGVKVALDDGHDRIVCAGIPMQRDAAHFARGQPWIQADGFQEAWKLTKPLLMGKVKSLSGWTQQLLGAPSAEWLNSP